MGNIVWVASYPKSGNTWVRAFLMNLLAPAAAPASINALNEICDNESNKRFYRRYAAEYDLSDLDTAARLRCRVQRQIAAATPHDVFLKTHNYFGSFNGFPLQDTAISAAAIYIVRNPLDLVLSMSHYYRTPIDETIDFINNEDSALEESDSNLACFISSWSFNVASWTNVPADDPRFCIIRYEDLLAAPLKPFRRIAALLGIRDPKAVKGAVKASSFNVLKQQEARAGFVENPNRQSAFFRVGRQNQWRNELTAEQVERVIAASRPMMEKFGYLPTGS